MYQITPLRFHPLHENAGATEKEFTKQAKPYTEQHGLLFARELIPGIKFVSNAHTRLMNRQRRMYVLIYLSLPIHISVCSYLSQ